MHIPHLTETPTSSCFFLQCDTSELNARNSNLGKVTSINATTAQKVDMNTHTTCNKLTNPVKARK